MKSCQKKEGIFTVGALESRGAGMLGLGDLSNFPDEIWSIGVMECWKWVHPVGERDPLLQLSITPAIRGLPIGF